MNLGQLIEYKKRNIFLQKHAENETGRLDPDLLLLFNKALYKIKKEVCCLVLIYLDSPQLGIQ